MAKAKKRVAARKKSSKTGNVSANKLAARRATPKNSVRPETLVRWAPSRFPLGAPA